MERRAGPPGDRLRDRPRRHRAATSYGTAAANQLAIPKGNSWYTDYDKYRYDIDKAKRLLRRGQGTRRRTSTCWSPTNIPRR